VLCAGIAGGFSHEVPELAAGETETPPISSRPDQPLVQMAILLDTSGSMSGLIDQARTEVWSVVNEFLAARRDGRSPEVYVALYEYGKSSLSREEGYLRQIVPLTRDLDKVSEELFALTTNGGDEYCGWVIRRAAEDLVWSNSPDDLKVIFIAGNEPFSQGPVDYREACRAAIARGIVVNTIHCGAERQGIEGKWKDGAVLADGRYLHIDQNRPIVHIAAPQDMEIAELGSRLNQTYIPYGQQGMIASERQVEQDRNASGASGEAVVQRAVTKSSINYRNIAWDLVDAVDANRVDLDTVQPEDLPQNMRAMNARERKAYVETQARQRKELQTRIQKLHERRKQYVAEEMKKQPEAQTLGSAIRAVIRDQAQQKNYMFQPSPSRTRDTQENSQQ
jgi:hypothetical protein